MTDKGMIRIAILGFGTVGAGVYQLVERQKDELEAKTGRAAEVAKVLVRNASKSREGIDASVLTDCFKIFFDNHHAC